MTLTVLALPVHDRGSSTVLGVLPFPSAVFYILYFFAVQILHPVLYIYAYLCSVSPWSFTSFGAQFLWLSGKMPWELKKTVVRVTDAMWL